MGGYVIIYMMDKSFLSLNKTVRAVILSDENILLCREKKNDWYFLPGWRVAVGEKSEDTLESNIREKLEADISEYKYIGATSKAHRIDRYKTFQEFDLVYMVKINNRFNYVESGNIEFIWCSLKGFREENILPKLLKAKLTEWFDNQEVFWGSN